jgi:hypothetical protein
MTFIALPAIASLFLFSLAFPQTTHTTARTFTDRGSNAIGFAGSFTQELPENGTGGTTILITVNYLRFVTRGFAPGCEFSIATGTEGNSFGLCPELVGGFHIPESPVTAFVAAGYEIYEGDFVPTHHGVKLGGGVILELVDHLGVTTEVAALIPIGAGSSDVSTMQLNIGLAYLGY